MVVPFKAFLWGLASALSLPLGAFIGLTRLPSERTRAALMAFGGGALLFALSHELFGHTICEAEHSTGDEGKTRLREQIGVMSAAALFGSALFAGLNELLNSHGAAWLRKKATRAGRLHKLRMIIGRRMLARLRRLHLFRDVPPEELISLLPHLRRVSFEKGDTIFFEIDRTSPLYMLIDGAVQLSFPPGSAPIFLDDNSVESPREDSMYRQRDQNEQGRPQECTDEDEKPGLGAEAVEQLGDEGSAAQRRASTMTLSQADLIGEMHLLTNEPCVATAIAIEPTRAIKIPRAPLDVLLANSEQLRAAFDQHALNALCDAPMFRRSGPQRSLGGSVVALGSRTDVGVCPDVPVTKQELRALLARSRRESFLPGDTLFNEVDHHSPLFILLSGSVEIYPDGDTERTNMESQSHQNCFVRRAGELLAEQALQKGQPSRALAVCREPCNTLVIRRHALEQLFDATMSLRPAFESEAERLRQLQLPTSVHGTTLKQAADQAPGPPTAIMGATCSAARSTPEAVAQFVPSSPVRFATAHTALENAQQSTYHSPRATVMLTPRTFSLKAEHNNVPELSLGIGASSLSDGTPTSVHASRASTLPRAACSVDASDASSNAAAPSAMSDAILASSALVGNVRIDDVNQTEDEHSAGMTGGTSSSGHAAVMIWLGLFIDSLPESLVIGFMVAENSKSPLIFIVGVFLSNFPEAMCSARDMFDAGLSFSRVMLLWCLTFVVTGLGAALGAAIVPADSGGSFELSVKAVEGVAAGAMLTMIAQTMLPEAFEKAGAVVGMATLVGFLAALMVKLI